ncbi:hypothetical protein [Sorangium cellulosum]|uniref:hypothetical protein n=1 Tax=Sorangium cellulosum TaxID=56 RepID=UPI00133176C9|nr:hypothetical protein [Sorangium cellulosum]
MTTALHAAHERGPAADLLAVRVLAADLLAVRVLAADLLAVRALAADLLAVRALAAELIAALPAVRALAAPRSTALPAAALSAGPAVRVGACLSGSGGLPAFGLRLLIAADAPAGAREREAPREHHRHEAT